MSSEEIRKKFLSFFESRGHAVVPSSSLIPDDPSVLLTTAGMQQFKKYYTGELNAEKDFRSKNTVSIQKCFRTSDIDEVGDESHLTFFEMLGNFSFGGYFKEEAIKLAHGFLTNKEEGLGLSIEYVTYFDPQKVSEGDWRKEVPRDDISPQVWKELGVKGIRPDGTDVFWGPTGAEGPCGPTTEVYIKNANGNAVEIWNIVFNEFYCDQNKKLRKLEISGVDTGMGLERLAMVSQNVPTIFETDLFSSLMMDLQKLPLRVRRILADHSRGIAFLISDGVRPSNKESGYILRRLMRRMITHLHLAKSAGIDPRKIFEHIVTYYNLRYPELQFEVICSVFHEEYARFEKTLEQGLRELNHRESLDTHTAFKLYESFGLPYEVLKELGGDRARNLEREQFDEEFRKHQEISRAGQEKKFGGHGLLLNTGELKATNEEELEKVTRFHTATHLLQQALRDVLGNEVEQRGSDITTERTRFDFVFSRKMTPEEIKKVEDIVNGQIKKDLPVKFREMPKSEAEKTGALYFFKEKYPDTVKVYFVGESLENAYSREFCGGPHVAHTGEIGKFRIIKEESVAAGVRRIRATVE